MRFIILLSFLGLSLISQASGICVSNERVSLMYKNDKIILKCDCNCTNEENNQESTISQEEESVKW